MDWIGWVQGMREEEEWEGIESGGMDERTEFVFVSRVVAGSDWAVTVSD
jgi:hypothetical protein